MRTMRHPMTLSFEGKSLWLGLLLLAALLLAGCTEGRGGAVAYDVALPTPTVQAQPVAATDAPIGALDTVQINVFQVESLSGEFKVDQAGAIDYPLLGTVPAQGRTAETLGQQIAAKLSEKYLQSPSVSVSVKERAEQTITVDGSVKQPGMFKVKGPTTLMQAVAMASGTTDDANPSRVIVFRTINGERLAGAFDLKAIRRAEAEDPVIYGNDIVVVDGSRARALFKDLMGTIPLLGILRPY